MDLICLFGTPLQVKAGPSLVSQEIENKEQFLEYPTWLRKFQNGFNLQWYWNSFSWYILKTEFPHSITKWSSPGSQKPKSKGLCSASPTLSWLSRSAQPLMGCHTWYRQPVSSKQLFERKILVSDCLWISSINARRKREPWRFETLENNQNVT
jgi:hypothetical protein